MPDTGGIIPAYALKISLIGISGTLFGMPAEALILGALGGAVALGRGQIMSRGQSLYSIFVSMLLAGTASPIAVAWAIKYIDLGTPEDEVVLLKALIPFVIGISWQWLLPHVISMIEQRLNKWKEKQ